MNPGDQTGGPAAESEAASPSPQPRRAFLAGAGAAALVGLGVACSPTDSATDEADQERAEVGNTGSSAIAVSGADLAEPVPFRRANQQGVLQAPAAAGAVVAFDVTATDRADLTRTLQMLSAEIERIMSGQPATAAEEILPPPDAGLLDASLSGGGTSITLALGSSLFDDRFGLADRRPAELIPMPQFFNDRLVQPGRSNGDLALVISSPSRQAVAYALQQAVRVTGRRLDLRWVQEGYNDLLPPAAGSVAPTRNLMGFRDGTSNLDTTDRDEMDRHIWVQNSDGEPAWATGGTYLAVRTIRILVEFWSTAALVRQEQIIGRHRESGAALGQSEEAEEPRFATDRNDESVPRQSHIRRANPRTADTGRILRRGFSYLNGADESGTLDQGLLFLAYQRSLSRGFLAAQARLDGEPMEDYIKPVGGGLFFVPPGPGAGDGAGWLGESLLA